MIISIRLVSTDNLRLDKMEVACMIGDGGRDKSHYCSLTTQTIRRRVFTPVSAVDTISCADAAAMNALVANLRNGTRGNLIRCRAAFIVPPRHAGARLIGDRYRHTSALVNRIHPVRPWYSDSKRAVLDHTDTTLLAVRCSRNTWAC